MDVPCEMLLHPELLTNEQLRYILDQRHLKVPNIETMPRDQLLEIFHQFCVPYGQRRYRDSGRGKILNKTRHMSPERTPTLNTMTNNQSKRSLYNSDRIKPPPDLLSGHMKKIKLENKSVPVNNLNIYKRKNNVESASSGADSPTPPKREKKPITWP